MFQKARRKLILPFLLPQIILFTLITLVPIIATVAYAFSDWQGQGDTHPVWAGLTQFKLITIDDLFLNAVRNSFFLMIVGGVLVFVPAFLMAWSLNQPLRLKKYYRFLILAPVVLSVSVAGLMWKWMYNPSFGLIGVLLKFVGHALNISAFAKGVIGDTNSALTAIIIASIWHGIGTWVLLLNAGFERIPPEIPESAKIDGASDWQIFWRITMPLMWEVVRTLLVLWVMQALQAFSFVYVMTGPVGVGGPLNSTELMATYVYKMTFGSYNWAYGMALATTMMIAIFLLSQVTNRALFREAVEF
jgi:ABC-type sugar transport system permease subunit